MTDVPRTNKRQERNNGHEERNISPFRTNSRKEDLQTALQSYGDRRRRHKNLRTIIFFETRMRKSYHRLEKGAYRIHRLSRSHWDIDRYISRNQ